MKRKYFSKRLWIVAVLGLVMVLQSSDAFARDRDRGGDRGRSREVVTVGHQRYSYHNGRFYKPGLFWLGIALGLPPLGAVVHFLPSGYRTVAVGGSTYYFYNNTYYTAGSSGYVVVPAPERVSINIPNFNGSYTTIVLVKQGGGYIGPQGEYYPGNPTVEQLQSLYGK